MTSIHFSILIGLCAMGACFLALDSRKRTSAGILLPILFSAALLLRLVAAALSKGFGSDTACFTAWAWRMCETGPAGFYSPDVFTDYPPGYLYVLWLVGGACRLLGIESYSAAHLVLLRLPSILSDMACGMLLCREASKRIGGRNACLLCMAYLLNPAVILNSSVWGQVDSLLALAAVTICLCLLRQRMYPAYIAFGIGFLIKPQMLFIGPVLFLGTLHWIMDGKKGTLPQRLLRCVLQCLSVAAGILLLCLPFGPETVWRQLLATIGSYPYAAVNACNLWGFFGLNWISQDETFLGIPYRLLGMAAIALVVATVFFLGRKRRRQDYAFLAALTVAGIFLFSVRMHERYLYPVLILLLLAYLYRPRPLTYLCYAAFSAMHFYNTAQVLFFYDPSNYDRRSASILLVSAGMLLCGGLLGHVAWRHYGSAAAESDKRDLSYGRGENTRKGQHAGNAPQRGISSLLAPLPPAPSRKPAPLRAMDCFWMLAITLLYSTVALYDLGDRTAPSTAYDMVQGQSLELDFGGAVPAEISYYMAPWHDRTFTLARRDAADQEWSEAEELMFRNVFTWQKAVLEAPSSLLRLTLKDTQASLLELVFTDGAGNILIPRNASEYPALFDEAALYPETPSFRNSMYFDEIYHGRTAYEFLHGLTSYENTHPPMGKILISLGVAVFGMNPFGWRIVGTLFGIAMVPILYLFARRITESTVLAALGCTLFAFDFMHFAQTRIATIDVYITFFVILMYYFMYQYSTLSFYDTSLKRTWLPLGACGVCMGLGIASKWTGVYAGAGLAVIFFSVLLRRYREYLCAKENPRGRSNGISHAHIVDSFGRSTQKTICFCLVFFVAVPAAIYLLSYLPFRDYSDRGLIGRLLYNQTTMYSYHSNLNATHDFSSSWYEWPLMLRPIWYYSRVVTQTAEGGLREGISSFGNPAVWWAGFLASLYLLYLWAAKRDRTAGFLTIGYLAQYLPWFFVTRITFIYHYFPSVPFLTLAAAYALGKCEGKGAKRGIPAAAAIYGLAAVALFALFYPVLSGQPVEAAFVAKYLRWYKSWVLTVK